MPRVDLSQIAARVAQADKNPGGLSENLPYEMVIVGVYPPGRDR
jgi:hypothetical protein